MKVLIISDLHGSLNSANTILKLYDAYNPDKIFLLGDLLYHGPRNDLPERYNPKEVIKILNTLDDKIIAVRGNCDAEGDQMVLSFDISATYKTILFDNHPFTLTHGHHYNEEKVVEGAKILLYGHTHIPVCHIKDGVVFFNPGSITIPKGGYKPTFGLYDNNSLQVRYTHDLSVLFSLEL